ncbi:aromatic hydrocarbon degradation protein [Sphingomonas sp. HMP9]|uniref:OmpP1/FadL family transporter n=1 Tax=Sphingomonas sp. HMP9 TaxID=1517554 RepID=UPI0015963FB3|nr:outer membrane protein transport protein [Sphingomonas sp. HMP9]BCA61536.1 aromatic hydrocarbon degradation protein [Sphingomonas sp. HMP9]
MTLRTKAPLLAVSALVSAFGFASTAYADAFYLQAQSARGAGRAFSGEAADTGAASLWWNPAAIAGIRDGSATLSASAILPKGDVIDNGTIIGRPTFSPTTGRPTGLNYTPVGGNGTSSDPINKGVVPSGAVAYPLTDRIAIGIAVTSPFSFTTNYEANSWARYSADKTRLRTIDVQPSIGIAVTDWLRVGGALNVEYTDATLNNALPNLSATLPDGFQELKGDGWDFGWSAGVQLHNDFATVGVSYKSSIRHNLKGSLNITGLVGPLASSNVSIDGAKASFNTPGQVIVAGRIRATNALTLNAQVVAYNWSKFDAIDLGAPLNVSLPENYQDSWSLAGGFDYDVTPKATIRAGVQRTKTPTQDGLRDARVPDADRWTYAAGGSYQLSSHIALDAAAQYVDFENTTIDRVTAAYAGTAVQTPIVTRGLLQNAHAVVLSLGGRVSF